MPTNIIQSILHLQNPNITIHFVSNDKFFSNYFFQKFEIEYKYDLIEHNYHELFLQEIQISEQINQKITFVIIDYIIENQDSLLAKSGNDICLEILKYKPNWHIIHISDISSSFTNDKNISTVIRNENAHQRIQNIITTKSNSYFIIKQKQSNKKTYIILSALITLISLLLVVFAIKNI